MFSTFTQYLLVFHPHNSFCLSVVSYIFFIIICFQSEHGADVNKTKGADVNITKGADVNKTNGADMNKTKGADVNKTF